MNYKSCFALGGLLLALNSVNASAITYDWQAPYAGASVLTIHNDSETAIDIEQLVFSTSAIVSNAPYGSLVTSGSEFEEDAEHKGTYLLSYSADKPFKLAAKASANLTIGYTTTYGPLPVGVTVSHVAVDGEELSFQGACPQCTDPTPGYRVTGYYTNWDQYSRQYDANEIPVTKTNTINYAFLDVKADGHIQLLDTNSDYRQLVAVANIAKKYPYMQTFLSFGGWTKSETFSDVFNDPAKRAIFVDEAVQAMEQTGFNGIDIDWEYPVVGPQGENKKLGKCADTNYMCWYDADNYGTVMQELRTKLNALSEKTGKPYYLSIAVGAGVDKIKLLNVEQWKRVAAAINYLNLMTYDFHGAFDYNLAKPEYSIADFHSAMDLDAQDPTITDPILKQYNVRDAVKNYLAMGFHKKQIVVGMPMYGRMVNVSTLGGDHYGLYQPLLATIPAGQYDDWQSGATGMFDYSCIIAAIDGGKCKGYTPVGLKAVPVAAQNKYAASSWSQWAYTDANQIITFDDAAGISNKSAWVKQEELGGAMFWSFSGDLPDSDSRALLNAAYQKLK